MPDKLKMMAWLGAKFTLRGQGVQPRSKATLRHSRSLPLRNSSETEYTSDDDSHPSNEMIIQLRSVDVRSYDPVPDALHPPDCECILCVDRILDEFPTPPPRPEERPPDMMEELIEVEILPDKVYQERRRRLESEQQEAARMAFVSYVCEKYNTQVREKQQGICQSICHTKEEWDILVDYHPAFVGQREERRRRLRAINRSSHSLDANMWLGSGGQEEERKPKLSNGPVAKRPELIHKTTVASVRPVQVSGLNQSVPEDVASDRSDDDSARRLRHQGLRNLAGKTTCLKCFKKASSGKGPLCKLHRHPRMPQSISLPIGSNHSTPPPNLRSVTDSVLVQNHRMVPPIHRRLVSDSTVVTQGHPANSGHGLEQAHTGSAMLKQSGVSLAGPSKLRPPPDPSSDEVRGSPRTQPSSTKATVAPQAAKSTPSSEGPAQLQQDGSQTQKKAVPPPISLPPKAPHLPRVTQILTDSASLSAYRPSHSTPISRPPTPVSTLDSLSPLRRRPAQSGHNPKLSNGSSRTGSAGAKALPNPPRPVNTRLQKPSPLPVKHSATHPSPPQPSSLRSEVAPPWSMRKDKPLPRYPAPERVEQRVYEGLQQRVREPSFSRQSARRLPACPCGDGTFPRRI
ncbi:hypothetical protein FA13DRAFT_1786483 [Coprinellus micaceus]|uniref:Uncharacterized protein n=1 Tax=Coprinellus micaceus TaxID=71717 RepID=A0A4Y7TTR0_COPMI|nr:hypothetical protein FA13DRAFT_1786483 [Coprinellus micaceus]